MTLSPGPSLDLYRPNVGIILARPDGQVWLGRRAGAPGPLNWQFPQGGVDEGESLFEAARRELHEETGATSVTLLGRTEDWIAYAFPEGFRRAKYSQGWIGQKQIWFLFRFDGRDDEFDLALHKPQEFDQWRWASPEEALRNIVAFKHSTYRAVLETLGPLIRGFGATTAS
jgi:putative (di)nucleoside polyphosphate hydrolase